MQSLRVYINYDQELYEVALQSLVPAEHCTMYAIMHSCKCGIEMVGSHESSGDGGGEWGCIYRHADVP